MTMIRQQESWQTSACSWEKMTFELLIADVEEA